ncbi:MAG TPA: hypothetical protein VLA84_19710 [Microcoleus sp.]|nr:hypothetical protein [Microcoleus sp.]
MCSPQYQNTDRADRLNLKVSTEILDTIIISQILSCFTYSDRKLSQISLTVISE